MDFSIFFFPKLCLLCELEGSLRFHNILFISIALCAVNINTLKFLIVLRIDLLIFISLCGEIFCIFKLYCYQKSINKGSMSHSVIVLNDETYIDFIFTF